MRAEAPELDPTPERRSKIGAWVRSLAYSIFDWYSALKDYADHEPFPQSARGDFLFNGWWRPLTKLDPIPATPARGQVALTGVNGTVVPGGTELQANNVAYTVQNSVIVVTQAVPLASVSYDVSSNRVVVTSNGFHHLANGISVTVSGAADAAYNGTFTITVADDDDFTYQPASVPSVTPVSGATITGTWAVATVEASVAGLQTNVSAGGSLTVQGSISGLDATAIATWGGINGGSDVETAEAYRQRILKALGTDFGAFTGDEIEIVVMSVPGVTRVWVRKATLNAANGVAEGQVMVAFARDNDATPIPSQQEVDDVKNEIATKCMTANTAIDDLLVIRPTARYIDYHLASITPDTVSMRAAIRAALAQFHAEAVDFATDISALDYECVIKGVYDMERRQKLQKFSLSLPVGDIAIGATELPLLGSVTFS